MSTSTFSVKSMTDAGNNGNNIKGSMSFNPYQ